ncbi:MAG TPA: hypothetical protein VND99_03745 [Candidatus Acidoferrales bacterium]|nr:hypothetical protein [Candidatus Acidoferrales bacterium]
MHKLNVLFTLTSVSVLLVTAERFSYTTKILLQPYNFLRLHEVIQMLFLILFTVVILFFIFYEVSGSFTIFTKRKLVWLPLLFIGGVYFYATGNGVHEMASYTLNQYCNVKSLIGVFCNGQYFNDYYTGNIFYFIGALLMLLPVLLTEKRVSNNSYQKKDVPVTVVNAVIYAFAIFAYAAFDPALVGLVYSVVIFLFSGVLWLTIRNKYLQYPVIFYTALTYTIGTIAALLFRFH